MPAKTNQYVEIERLSHIRFPARTTPTLLVICLLFGCGYSDENQTPTLRIATSTSVRDSGLIDELIPKFEKQESCYVEVVSVGSGAALHLGKIGDVDLVLTHSPKAEKEFMDQKHGIEIREIMYNFFVLIGPESDPANVQGDSVADGLNKIESAKSKFLSRGDQSGTHQMEIQLWKKLTIQPSWKGYLESGQGMGKTMIMADQMQAYTMTDIGTFLRMRDRCELVIHSSPSDEVRNPYSAMIVNPNKKDSNVSASLARKLFNFLINDSAQSTIDQYRVDGERLFYPAQLYPTH